MILEQEAIVRLDTTTCSFTTLTTGELKVVINVNDVTSIDSTVGIQFKDVFFYINGDTKLPISLDNANIPELQSTSTMQISMLIPDSITSCEYLAINYMNSIGIGTNPEISITLDALKSIDSNTFVTSNLTAYQDIFNNAILSATQEMQSSSSMVLMIPDTIMAQFEGYTLYILYSFTNTNSGEEFSDQTSVDVLLGVRYEVSDLDFVISRTQITTINTVTKINCDQSIDTLLDNIFECRVHVQTLNSSSGAVTAEIAQSALGCQIDPTLIDVDNIVSIKVYDSSEDVTINVPFSIEAVK